MCNGADENQSHRYDPYGPMVQEQPSIASYFHKGLMWRRVKVEKSRKNGFSYDKAIFWQNLYRRNFSTHK